ncbi:hypothetical protein D9M71_573500 [compost metagenome]
MLGVKDRMHCGQADVLVDPSVACDVVRIQQLVVVGQVGPGMLIERHCVADFATLVRNKYATAEHRHCIVVNVGEELMACAHGMGQVNGGLRITLDKVVIRRAAKPVSPLHHNHREAVRPLDEIAIGVGRQQRGVVDVGIGEVDTQNVFGLCLDHFPGRHTTDLAVV